jgi:hypothetical protein
MALQHDGMGYGALGQAALARNVRTQAERGLPTLDTVAMGMVPFGELHLGMVPWCMLATDTIFWRRQPFGMPTRETESMGMMPDGSPPGLPWLDTRPTGLLPFNVKYLGMVPAGMKPLDATSSRKMTSG